jgi:hypothetical protein
MIKRILLLVRSLDEVELARALVAALPDHAFRLVFSINDLCTRFGATPHPTSIDVATVFLEAHTYRLAVCFSGGRDLGPNSNLLPLVFLNEVGVPTVEIQRDLLQDVTAAAQDSVARHYLSWSGAGNTTGIGNLKSVWPPAHSDLVRDDVVAVSSRLDGDAYNEEEQHRFVLGVLRLAREHPQLTFVWRQSVAETQLPEVAGYWTMVQRLGPRNIHLEENEGLPLLLARAGAVIGMAATPLLDAAPVHTPGLVFVSPSCPPGLGGLVARTFSDYAGLSAGFRQLREAPDAFRIGCSLPALQPSLLAEQLAQIAAGRSLQGDVLSTAVRHLATFQEARARVDLTKRIVNIEQRSGRQESQQEKLVERLGVLQRSSVAYRAMQLLGRVRKGALKPK